MVQMATCDRTRLMIADDDPVIRRLFQAIVSDELPGMAVETYSDGSAAVGGFIRYRPGVVVMDLHMPVMDGVRAFDEIEKLCHTDGVCMPCVVFCTAFAVGTRIRDIIDSDKRHCLLRKPITSNQLMAAIRVRLSLLAKEASAD